MLVGRSPGRRHRRRQVTLGAIGRSGRAPRAAPLDSLPDEPLARPAVPAGGDLRRQRHELLALLRDRGAGRAVPLRRRRHRRAASSSRRSRPSSTTATCRASSPGSATGSGCTDRGSPTRACGQPGQAADRPLRQGRRGRGAVERCRVRPTRRTRDPAGLADQVGQRAVRAPLDRGQPVLRLGRRPPPRIPWHETIVYETHVRGLTMRHPDVPEDLRGTYSGLASEPIIEHLKHLGVTAVELMPVHQFIHDRRLLELGLRNYWGYNSIALPRPAQRLRQLRPARPAGAGVQADGRRPCTRPASR